MTLVKLPPTHYPSRTPLIYKLGGKCYLPPGGTLSLTFALGSLLPGFATISMHMYFKDKDLV